GDLWLAFWIFFGAGACGLTMVLIWRAMSAPVPALFDTKEFPHPRVRLTAVTVRVEKVPSCREMKPLSEFVSEAIRLAGQHLSAVEAACGVGVKLGQGFGRREVIVMRPDALSKDAARELTAEIKRLPEFRAPDMFEIELRFVVTA